MPHEILSLTGPQSVIAAVPYLLGFVPSESLVLLLSADGELSVSMRVDLPPPPEIDDWAADVCLRPPVQDSEAAVCVIYTQALSEEDLVACLDEIDAVLSQTGVEVLDRLVVRDGRFRSLDCTDGCCPAEGRPLDRVQADPTSARFVLAGRSFAPNREALADRVRLQPGGLTDAVMRYLGEHTPPATWDQCRALEDCAVDIVTKRRIDPDAGQIALLALACADVHVRDAMIVRALKGRGRGTTHPVCQWFITASRHCTGTWRANLLAVAALTLWADGDGASAIVTAEAALLVDPEQSLASLVRHAVGSGLPPETWMEISSEIPFDRLRGGRRRCA